MCFFSCLFSFVFTRKDREWSPTSSHVRSEIRSLYFAYSTSEFSWDFSFSLRVKVGNLCVSWKKRSQFFCRIALLGSNSLCHIHLASYNFTHYLQTTLYFLVKLEYLFDFLLRFGKWFTLSFEISCLYNHHPPVTNFACQQSVTCVKETNPHQYLHPSSIFPSHPMKGLKHQYFI